MPSSTARTIATSPAIDNRPSVGVMVVNPSFCNPATTVSQPGGEAQAPWTRTIVGLASKLLARGGGKDRDEQNSRDDENKRKQTRPRGAAGGAFDASSA